MSSPDLTHGSRWWKMDFHAHTPHSSDWEKCPPAEPIDKSAPRSWLRRYMEAGIDAVAITDHNGGGFIDPLKRAYAALATEPDPPDWFRPLTLFPGVEITVTGDLHLLAIFDPSAQGEKITRVLAQAGFKGEQGAADGTTTQSIEQVCRVIVDNGGLAIPAHVDDRHGLLETESTESGETSCKGSSRDILSLIESGLVIAFEVSGLDAGLPHPARDRCSDWPWIAGTDWHNWNGHPEREPGRRFTWVKMGEPNLEGLRLALQEGFPGSIRRFDEADRYPITPPAMHIATLRIKAARYAGRNPAEPLDVPFSPWLTALIGGRGSGKSTVVHLLRLAMDRGDELVGEVRQEFLRFTGTDGGNRSDDDGALTGDTNLAVDYVKNGQRYRLRYTYGHTGITVHEIDADGNASPVDGSARDFPVRIFSQKQIYHLASDPSALLSLIDETPRVDHADWQSHWDKLIADYRSARARARAERAATAGMSTLRHQRQDLARQLAELESGENRLILQDYQRSRSQRRQFEIREEQSLQAEANVRALLEELAPPDPPLAAFAGEDSASVAGRELLRAADRDHRRLTDAVRAAADAYAKAVSRWKAELDTSPWSEHLNDVEASYTALTSRMAASGIESPDGYTRLVREKQLVESRLATAMKAEKKAEDMEAEAEARLDALLEHRKELTRRRRAFLAELPDNDHVRIEVVGFGSTAESAEAGFREAINKTGDSFDNDVQRLLGRIYRDTDLPSGDERDAATLQRIVSVRVDCLQGAEQGDHEAEDRRFVNHLRSLDAEQLDRLRTWWPDDDVHVQYRDASGRLRPIGQASAGQKSAAILAFILGHGNEPLILDQPEDDLDNHLIFDLIVKALGSIKRQRQVVVVTHNPNIVVNGDAELVNAMQVHKGQIIRGSEGSGCLQDTDVRQKVCDVMEGGREAFERRYRRVVKHVS